jgi:hypothetical protein
MVKGHLPDRAGGVGAGVESGGGDHRCVSLFSQEC